MNIIESLTQNKRKFLESLGIKTDSDIPKSFFDKIESFKENTTSCEQFYCEDYNFCGAYRLPFSVADIVGSDHDVYAGKSWLEAFIRLARGEEIIEEYFQNPSYYSKTLKNLTLMANAPHSTNIGIVKKGKKLYVYSRAGGGNNRMILMKIKYLAMANGKNEEELEKLNNEFTFYGNVRILPENVKIPELVEKLVWDNNDLEYYVENISSSPNTRIFNILQGSILDRHLISSNLSEEEFVVQANGILQQIISVHDLGKQTWEQQKNLSEKQKFETMEAELIKQESDFNKTEDKAHKGE